MLWDGDYVYVLIEVYDTTLTARNDAYVKGGVDSYFNDAVELWYSFEQDATLTKNNTRVGLAAAGDNIEGVAPGQAKYALPRTWYSTYQTGIGGGRSTHFDNIEYAVRNHYYDSQLGRPVDGLDGAGVTAPSYVIELKIPAKPEAEADLTKAVDASGEKLTGTALEDFKATGLLPGKNKESNNINDYAFTTVDNLMVGDYVRFCLQINDLKILADDLANTSKYFDTPASLQELQALPGGTSLTQAEYDKVGVKLFEFDGGANGTQQWVAVKQYDKFTAAGSTQNELSMYLMFSLGGSETDGSYKVESFAKHLDDRKKQTMVGKDGHEYIRPTEVVEE